MKKLFILIPAIILSTLCSGQSTQYVGHATLKNTVKSEILIDTLTGVNFILDTTHIYITAINATGDTIWRTDPWKDNKLSEYRVKRPVIVYFNFGIDKRNNNKDVIWITYNNTQFGFIDKNSGVFDFKGQD